MKILIADHSGSLQAPDLSALLSAGGHEVRTVHDGIHALRVARAWTPELLLASVHLPRMDGLALTAALRELAAASAPAIILFGPAADFHARSRGRELGIAAYAPLPVEVASLLRAVWRVEHATLAPAPPRRRRGIPGARRKAG